MFSAPLECALGNSFENAAYMSLAKLKDDNEASSDTLAGLTNSRL